MRKQGFVLMVLVSCLFGTVIDCKAENQMQEIFKQGWEYFSLMHIDLKNLDKALVLYKKGLSLDDNNPNLYWKLAEVTFKKADETKDLKIRKQLYQETLAYARKCLALVPKSPEGHYWVGTTNARLAEIAGIFSALGLVKEARKDLEKCIELAPQNRFSNLARVILTAIYTQSPWPLKDIKKANKLVKEAIARDPNLTLARNWLAKLYIKKKKYQKASTELQHCLNNKKPTYIWDAVLYDWPEAKKLLRQIKK